MPLRGRRVLITAGPTRERLDPVRYLTNASSGAMGFALASAARARGARVTVVCGPVSLPAPKGVELVPVESALEMHRETLKRARGAALVVGAAAVSDWRPVTASRQKIKRRPGPVRLTLIPNPDIIRSAASRRRKGQVFVGFALETRDVVAHARGKLVKKGLDLVVANGPENLGSARAKVTLVGRDGERRLEGTKAQVARLIVAEAETLLARQS